MALRILQFGIVFAIGFHQLGTVTCDGALYVGPINVTEIPLSIHLKDPEDVVAIKGQSAALYCHVEYSNDTTTRLSAYEFTWYYNGNLIHDNDTRWLNHKNGTLFLPKVVRGKQSNGGVQGDYRCMVANNFGSVLSNKAKVRIASFDRDVAVHPGNLSVPEFQPAVIFCNIHSVPKAEIQWEYNESQLPPDTRYVPLPTGALLITKIHSSDAGSYRCKATNSLLNKVNLSKIVHITVTPRFTNIIAPTFLPLTTSSSNTTIIQTVLIDENVDLFCAVTGWPIPNIQWLDKNGTILSNSSILKLKTVQLSDSGNYKCTAQNSGGRISEIYTLQVHQKPNFIVTPKSILFPTPLSINMNCQAIGEPEPKFEWFKNGQKLNITGRITITPTGLHFSHTFTSDKGIYQCFASNSAGRIWTASQLMTSKPSPLPPENVQCRSHDHNSICLTWIRPDDVMVKAYVVNTLTALTEMGPEVLGQDYVTNATYALADNLNSSTNYTFYVRLFSNVTSDKSNSVICETGVKGSRNLKMTVINQTSVALNWSKISSDEPCNGTRAVYRVMWRMKGRESINSNNTPQFSFTVYGLKPNITYEFRVVSIYYYKSDIFDANWSQFIIPDTGFGENSFIDNGTLNAPEKLAADSVSATTINLSWLDFNTNAQYFTVCSSVVNQETTCKETKSTSLQLSDLEPGTVYEFKVRSHRSSVSSIFSEPIRVRTDVSSSVVNLTYKIVNETAVCLRWKAPNYKQDIIQFQIFYTTNKDWPLEKWLSKNVSVSLKQTIDCWLGDARSFSVLLEDLKPHTKYTVFAIPDKSFGEGEKTKMIDLSTDVTRIKESSNDLNYDRTYGIILGVVIALCCIIVCIFCILFRRRCVKNRIERARMAANSSDYYQAAHYTSDGNTVHVRFAHPCLAETYEIEQLVAADDARNTHFSTVIPTHLDTKGNSVYPNGHLNGSAKSDTNGYVLCGDLRITENPRFNYGVKKSNNKSEENLSSHCEEDSNSNLKAAKMQDLHRLYENSKLSLNDDKKKILDNDIKKSNHQCNSYLGKSLSKLTDLSVNNTSFKDVTNSSLSSSEDGSLNSTQVTCLDHSFASSVNNKRISPIVGPNG